MFLKKVNNFFIEITGSTIKTDVFEPLYQRSLPKTKRSESPQFDGNTYRKPRFSSLKVHSESGSENSDTSKPVKTYFYGEEYKTHPDDDDDHKRDSFHVGVDRKNSFASTKSNTPEDNKKVTNVLSWFVNVKGATDKKDLNKKHEPKGEKIEYPNDDYRRGVSPPRRGANVRRSETFKIEKDDFANLPVYSPSPTPPPVPAIKSERRVTVTRNKMEPIRVEIRNPITDRNGKIVPVGVTAPYNQTSRYNDYDQNSDYSDDKSQRVHINDSFYDYQDYYDKEPHKFTRDVDDKTYRKKPVFEKPDSREIFYSNRHDHYEPRNEPIRESRYEPRYEPRNEPRHEPKNYNQSIERKSVVTIRNDRDDDRNYQIQRRSKSEVNRPYHEENHYNRHREIFESKPKAVVRTSRQEDFERSRRQNRSRSMNRNQPEMNVRTRQKEYSKWVDSLNKRNEPVNPRAWAFNIKPFK